MGEEAMEGKGKPHGGYVFVSATGLLATWWSYKAGIIQFRDVRAWLACHEAKARRCTLEKGRLPRFTEAEIGRLVSGVGGEHVRASIRRLKSATLLTWSETAIEFRRSTEGLPSETVEFVESVTNHRRRIPVPRPLLRFLAGETRPVLVATALGHLLRCMYFRKGHCEPRGLCKASWIAGLFGVDERNVKAARKSLESLGVLLRSETPQLVMNRYGVSMRLNLNWSGPTPATPPQPRQSTTETPRPRETGISSFRRSGNQKLGTPSGPGVRKRTGRGPQLHCVTVLDLEDPRRTLELHRQAAFAGLVGFSEADRLKVLSLAAHARIHAKRNAPGLFVSALRSRRWYLTQHDEDCGRQSWRMLNEAGAKPCDFIRHRRAEPEDAAHVRELIARSLASVRGRGPDAL